MKTYRKLSQLIALTGALIISALPMGRAEEKKKTDESKIQLMFVQTADDLKADGNTLRLVNVGQQTLYFSDRQCVSPDILPCLHTWTNGKQARARTISAATRPTPRSRFMSPEITKTRLPWLR